jgi:Protein of unknown function (DUF2752)
LRSNRPPAPAARVQALMLFVCMGAGLAALRLMSLQQLDQVPPLCLWSRLLGRPCPGCGTLHALCAVLHGDLSLAWHYNPNVVLVVPLLVVIAFAQARFLWRGWRRAPASSSAPIVS